MKSENAIYETKNKNGRGNGAGELGKGKPVNCLL